MLLESPTTCSVESFFGYEAERFCFVRPLNQGMGITTAPRRDYIDAEAMARPTPAPMALEFQAMPPPPAAMRLGCTVRRIARTAPESAAMNSTPLALILAYLVPEPVRVEAV